MTDPLKIAITTTEQATCKGWNISIGGIDLSKYIKSMNINVGVGEANIVTIEFINVAITKLDGE
jgi:hypothetical protein